VLTLAVLCPRTICLEFGFIQFLIKMVLSPTQEIISDTLVLRPSRAVVYNVVSLRRMP
jgi:hypothetical protein